MDLEKPQRAVGRDAGVVRPQTTRGPALSAAAALTAVAMASVRQSAVCLDRGVAQLRDGLCWSCAGWRKTHWDTAMLLRCARPNQVDGDGLCRPCAMAVREEISAGSRPSFLRATQLRVYVLGLGQQE